MLQDWVRSYLDEVARHCKALIITSLQQACTKISESVIVLHHVAFVFVINLVIIGKAEHDRAWILRSAETNSWWIIGLRVAQIKLCNTVKLGVYKFHFHDIEIAARWKPFEVMIDEVAESMQWPSGKPSTSISCWLQIS